MDAATQVTPAEARKIAPIQVTNPRQQSSMYAGKSMKTEGLRISELDIDPVKTREPSPPKFGTRSPVYLWSPTRETKPQSYLGTRRRPM